MAPAREAEREAERKDSTWQPRSVIGTSEGSREGERERERERERADRGTYIAWSKYVASPHVQKPSTAAAPVQKPDVAVGATAATARFRNAVKSEEGDVTSVVMDTRCAPGADAAHAADAFAYGSGEGNTCTHDDTSSESAAFSKYRKPAGHGVGGVYSHTYDRRTREGTSDSLYVAVEMAA